MTDNGTITEESRRYDAFLSYSHSDDTALAADLVATLETIAKPWYRRRALRVFRDKSSLAATAALWSSLRRSLDQSEFLVLLATPAAAKSEGVQREICHWLKTRSSDTILIALAEGTIEWDESVGDFDWERTAALPWELKGSFAEEPLHADLRAFRLQSAARRKNPEFLNAVGDLAAPIRKISKDELLGEQLRQHRRTMRIAWSAAGIFAALTVAVTIASVIAVQQRNEAILQSELSRSRELAAASRALIDQDRRRSIQLALDSLDTADTAEAHEGLLRGMIASHNIIALIGGTTAAAVFDPADRVYWAQGNKIFTWNLDCSEPQSTVATLAFEPERLLVGEDGTRLLAVDGGTFALIAMPGGEVLQQETEPRRAVFDEAVMSDSVFAVAHNVNTVSVWRAADGTQIGTTLRGPLGPVSAMALSSDSRLLATADEAMARRVLLWKIQDDAPEATEVAGVADSVGGLAFIGPDRLLVGTDKLVVYDVSDPRNPIVAFDMSVARRITALAARADGRFVTGHSDGTVIVWQREPDDSLTRLQSYEHDTEIRRVAAPPRTEIFIAVGGATWRMIHPGSPETLLGPSSSGRAAIADLTTSRDGRVLATVDTDGRLSVWSSAIPPLVGHDIEYATAKSMLLSARMNEVLRWTNDAQSQVIDFGDKAHALHVQDIAISPDGRYAASGSADESVRLWSTDDPSSLIWLGRTPVAKESEFDGNPGAYSVDFSPDSRLLAFAFNSRANEPDRNWTGQIQVWDVVERILVAQLDDHPEFVSKLRFDPDGASLIYADYGNELHRWSWQSAAIEPVEYAGHDDWINDFAISSTGTTIASGSDDDTVIVRTGESHESVVRLTGHVGSVRAVGLNADASRLASGDFNGNLIVWQIPEGNRLAGPMPLPSPIWQIVFAPDNRSLAVVRAPGLLDVFPITNAALRDSATNLLTCGPGVSPKPTAEPRTEVEIGGFETKSNP